MNTKKKQLIGAGFLVLAVSGASLFAFTRQESPLDAEKIGAAAGTKATTKDGVIRGHPEPAIIAICGMAPVNYKLVDPSKPGWRAI